MPPLTPPNEAALPRGALLLERRQGFADRAVIGGMAGLLQRWTVAALTQTTDKTLRRALRALHAKAANYSQASREDRRDLLAEAERIALRLATSAGTRGAAPGNSPLVSAPPTTKAAATTTPAATAAAASPAADTAALTPGWHASLASLRGIGPARLAELNRVGLHTVGDLLQFYPARHEDRRHPQSVRELEHRQSAVLVVTVTGPGKVTGRWQERRALVPATDGADPVDLVWFHQPYRATQFAPGTRLVVTGQARRHQGRVAFAVTEAEVAGKDDLSVGRLTPIYSAPPFSQTVMRRLVAAALEACTDYPEDRVPPPIVARRGLVPLATALHDIHFPPDSEALRLARARIAYEELFLLQVRLALKRRQARHVEPASMLATGDCLSALRGVLPFALTGAQERVGREVLADLAAPEAANRLIHGDVGSGKTVIAALALLAAARAGQQGVLMAPTELLARQHHQTLTTLLEPLGITPVLLVGSMTAAERAPVRAALASGAASLAVGTHALFQEGVAFARLAVAVIDEQHRFGVRQRALLVGKGQRPNTFIMSATPIPRTLALTAYGDFDVSLLDELPPGRRPVHTEVITRKEIRRAFRLLSDVVERGQQAYLVCPLIEESADGFRAAAEALVRDLKTGIFPSLKVGLVHGKLPAEERDAIMEAFRQGQLEVLVATTVIEVGVDVPNATAMVILDAERFGLAQLHQLRGRVARSRHQAYCCLVTNARSADALERLKVLERTSDGFLVAEEDLRRRGPGELAGWRQSGLPDPRMADFLADTPTLARAREDAFALVAADPGLQAPAHAPLRAALGPAPRELPWTF